MFVMRPFTDIWRLLSARKHRHRYSQIVPLGVNCEVAFRFYRSWGFVDSSLAAWAQLFNLDTAINMLRNLPQLMTGEATFDPKSKMWTCENCHVRFHGKLKYGHEDSPEEIASDLADLRGRVDHLLKKLIDYASNDHETLFIHRLAEADEREIEKLAARLDALEASLVKLGARNWKLLVICETPYLDKMPMGPNRVFRAVDRFNPSNDITNAKLGDGIGWKAIFSEFAPAKVLPKQHGFKFE